LGIVFAGLTGKAQKLKGNLISSFDSIEYYSNDTIKAVYQTKKEMPKGYSIEFDSTGKALKIGKYSNGKKTGYWLWENGTRESCSGKYEGMMFYPGCGTGIIKRKREFQTLYEKLALGK